MSLPPLSHADFFSFFRRCRGPCSRIGNKMRGRRVVASRPLFLLLSPKASFLIMALGDGEVVQRNKWERVFLPPSRSLPCWCGHDMARKAPMTSFFSQTLLTKSASAKNPSGRLWLARWSPPRFFSSSAVFLSPFSVSVIQEGGQGAAALLEGEEVTASFFFPSLFLAASGMEYRDTYHLNSAGI